MRWAKLADSDIPVGGTDGAPSRLTVAASRLVGRKATGTIAALTAAEAIAILGTTLTDALLPWRVDIDVMGGPAASTDTWAIGNDASAAHNAHMDSTGAQNAQIDYSVVLAAGAWTMELLHTRSTNRGVYTVSLDDGAGSFTALGSAPFSASAGTNAIDGSTIEGYAASATRNIVSTITGIVIGSTLKRTFRLKMATKNASSSNYQGSLQHIVFRRTA